MKFLASALILALLAFAAGCASTTSRSASGASIAPGALAAGQGCPEGVDCPPCEGGEACTMTCEPLPDGTCLVTCYINGEVCCKTVCDPAECGDCGDCGTCADCTGGPAAMGAVGAGPADCGRIACPPAGGGS
jgi:hypothetical protein